MDKTRDTAIVLRSIAYEERHKIVTALSEKHGLITAMARNSIQSRRFGGTLDPFVASVWHFSEKPGAELLILHEAEVKMSFEGLRADFEKLAMASVFNELMLKLAPHRTEALELFKLHSNALLALESAEKADIRLLNGYMAKLLQWSGNQPQLLGCMHCQTPLQNVDPEISVSCVVQDAGWVCSSCRTEDTKHLRERGQQSFDRTMLRITPIGIADFLTSLTVPIRQIIGATHASDDEHRELFKFMEALFIYHIPGFDLKPLKGLRFLDLESNSLQPPKNLR